MPVKWTPENDQLLLLKILETHELSVDTKRVALAWPGDPKNKPTARAITERLVRMRQMVKASSNGTEGHFSIGKGTSSNTPTPSKSRSACKTTTSSTGKRKRGANNNNRDYTAPEPDIKMELADSSDVDFDTPTRKPVLQPTFTAMNYAPATPRIGTSLKLDPEDDDPFLDMSPSKRVSKASVLPPGMVNYVDDEEDKNEGNKDDDVDSSISEYHPEFIKSEVEDDNWA